jgi:hypothetical protein
MSQHTEQIKPMERQGIYRVESGTAMFPFLREKRAVERCKSIGLARCETAKVIAPNGKVVYEF